LSKKEIRLEPFEYSSGEATRLLEIFKKMYYSDYLKAEKKKQDLEKKTKAGENVEEEIQNIKHWRHWVLWGRENSIIFFQKSPTTNLNEFILHNPTAADLKIITSFCSSYQLDFFEVPRVNFVKAE
jgi:hypothetical protein